MPEDSDLYDYYIELADDEIEGLMRGPYSRAVAERQLKEGEKIVRRLKLEPLRDEQASANFYKIADAHRKMLKEVRNWGIWLLIIGGISIFAGGYLSAPWGVLLIFVGLSSFYFRSSSMFVIYGVVFSWAAITNLLSGQETWIFASIVQVVFAVLTFRKFFLWRKTEREYLAAEEQIGQDEAQVVARAAGLFPWIGCFLGSLALFGFITVAFGYGIYLAVSQNIGESSVGFYIDGLLIDFAVLGFAAGLASLLQGYRPKWPSIAGMILAVLLLLIELIP